MGGGGGQGITYSECISVASVIQDAMRMRRIILLSVISPAVPYFSTLSHKQRDFLIYIYIYIYIFPQS